MYVCLYIRGKIFLQAFGDTCFSLPPPPLFSSSPLLLLVSVYLMPWLWCAPLITSLPILVLGVSTPTGRASSCSNNFFEVDSLLAVEREQKRRNEMPFQQRRVEHMQGAHFRLHRHADPSGAPAA